MSGNELDKWIKEHREQLEDYVKISNPLFDEHDIIEFAMFIFKNDKDFFEANGETLI